MLRLHPEQMTNTWDPVLVGLAVAALPSVETFDLAETVIWRTSAESSAAAFLRQPQD